MIPREELERRLRNFVNQKLLGSDPAAIVDSETLLFEEGVINSLRILDLIAFLEKALGTRIPDAAVTLANFRSIRTIAQTFVKEDTDGAP